MTTSDNIFPDAPRPRGRLLDARLHLLDRQLLDDDGAPVGIVDDLELSGAEFGALTAGARPPRVTGLVSGHVLATRIFGVSHLHPGYKPFPGGWSPPSPRWYDYTRPIWLSMHCGSSTGFATT